MCIGFVFTVKNDGFREIPEAIAEGECFVVGDSQLRDSENCGTSQRLAIPSALGEAEFSCLPMMMLVGCGLTAPHLNCLQILQATTEKKWLLQEDSGSMLKMSTRRRTPS
jgi:hypothetical protein